jgi:hypothetical protein
MMLTEAWHTKFGLSGYKRANSLLTVEVKPIKCGIFLFVLTRAFQKRKKKYWVFYLKKYKFVLPPVHQTPCII